MLPTDFLIGPLGTLVDDEGRPLNEGKTPADRRGDVPMVFAPCPYPGSRATTQRPMNTSALDQVVRHLRGALADLAFLRGAFLARGEPHELTAADLWHLCTVATYVPAFLAARADRPCPVIPAPIGALYKVTAGLWLLCDQLAWHELVGLPVPALTADALYERAEVRGFLVGPAEACAAPESMIQKALDVMVRGDDVEHAELPALLPDPGALFRFGACVVDHLVLTRMLDLIAIGAARDLGAAPGTPQLEALRPRFVRDLGLAIAELAPEHRALEIVRPAELLLGVSERCDDELAAAVDAVSEVLDDPSRPPLEVFAAGERAIRDGLGALRGEAHEALGRPVRDQPSAEAASLGTDWRELLASISAAAPRTPR